MDDIHRPQDEEARREAPELIVAAAHDGREPERDRRIDGLGAGHSFIDVGELQRPSERQEAAGVDGDGRLVPGRG
jgi:hypothetical protein